jgi:hypothetical protein
MSCLEACQTRPDNIETTLIHDQYRLVIPKAEDINGRLYFPYEEMVCEKRKYKISPEFIGPLSDFVKVAPQDCTALIGNKPTPYVKTFNLMEYVRGEIQIFEQE